MEKSKMKCRINPSLANEIKWFFIVLGTFAIAGIIFNILSIGLGYILIQYNMWIPELINVNTPIEYYLQTGAMPLIAIILSIIFTLIVIPALRNITELWNSIIICEEEEENDE